MKLEIVKQDGGITHVRIAGAMSQSAISSFADLFRDQLGATVYQTTLLLDMGYVDWLDSSGVGWLLGCQRRFRESGGRLVLHSLAPRVNEVFRVLNLNTAFEIAANAAAANGLTGRAIG
jgi:anti-sigma B factor antagonist